MLSNAQAAARGLLTHNVFMADKYTKKDSKESGKECVNSFRWEMRRGEDCEEE